MVKAMVKQLYFLLLLVVLLPFGVQAQKNDDPVLFTVGSTPVHLSEFKYIYSKTNGPNADFSKKSIDEYLDLYVKFKLNSYDREQAYPFHSHLI